MAEIPIPDDWDGKATLCAVVQWPDSPSYRAILRGLLYLGTRGRFWNEATGTVKDVQAVMRDFYAQNVPLVFCDGGSEAEPETCGTCSVTSYLEDSCEESCEMAVCGYNPDAFRQENGLLYVRDICGDWVQIAILNGAPEDGTYNPPEDTDYDVQSVYPCGMAMAVAELIEKLAGYIWDEADNTFPLYMAVKAQNYIGLDLNNLETVNAANQALVMKGSVAISYGVIDLERSDVIEPTMVARIACSILPLMQADGTVDKDELWAALTTYFKQRFKWAESGNNIFITGYYNHILNSLGKGNLQDAAVAGQFTDGGDCVCPDAYGDYVGAVTFEDARTIVLQSQGATLYSSEQLTPRVMQHILSGGVNENYQEVHWNENLAATGVISEMQIEFPLMSSTIAGFYPAYNWSDANPTAVSNYMKTAVIVPEPDSTIFYPQPNKQVVVMKWASPVNLNGSVLRYQVKMNPKDQNPTRQIWTFRALITYAGDTRL